jgi:hypothetical protein
MKSTTILLAAAIVGLGLALSNGIYTAILIDARPDALPNYVVFNKFTGSQCWHQTVWEAFCPESARVISRPKSADSPQR